jgi:LysR family transcriptional regulator, transcriptional activator of the cysJI operon
MDYRLNVFLEVADHRSITRAGRALHLSQSAVTKNIKMLEDEVGVPLFIRTPNGMNLTEAGLVYVSHVRQMSKAHNDIVQRLRTPGGIFEGKIRLGTSRTILAYFLPRIIASFTKKYPAVTCELVEGDCEAVVDSLLARRVDLALIEGPCRRPEIVIRPFLQDKIVWIAAPKHPLAGRTVTPREVLDTNIICREQGDGDRKNVEAALKKRGLLRKRLTILQEAYSAEITKELVKAGVAIAYISSLAVERELKSGELVRIRCPKLDVDRSFSLIFPQGPEPAGLEGAFVNLLMEMTAVPFKVVKEMAA